MESVKKSDFIKMVAEKSGISQEGVKNVIEAMDEVSLNELTNGKKVVMSKVVSLTPVQKAATSGTSPFNNKKWESPAHTAVKAEVSKKYKKL